MPSLDTPFATTLGVDETIVLSSGNRGSDAETDGTAAAATAGNAFQAMLSSIVFREGDAAPSSSSSSTAAADTAVRVALVAELAPPRSRNSSSSSNTNSFPDMSFPGDVLTVASYIFPSVAVSRAAAAGAGEPGGVARLTPPALALRSPLFFSSRGQIRSLRVLAHRVPEARRAAEEEEEDDERETAVEMRAYRGPRRFTVTLLGVQQTELTDKQVLLLSNYQE